MKKRIILAILVAPLIFGGVVFATQEDKVNICHKTASETHPWEAINVNKSAFDGEGDNDHTQHGDFLYNGPVKDNGKPTKEGNAWCEENAPEEEVDVCPNIVGNQATVPEGKVLKEGKCEDQPQTSSEPETPNTTVPAEQVNAVQFQGK